MAKNCKHNVPCGCEDTGFTTPPPCNSGTPECPTPETCAEIFCEKCIVYCGDDIVELGLNQGERLDVTMQRLTLFLTNPDCIQPDATCKSVVGLKSTTITSTTIALSWLAEATAIDYQVEYKLASSLTWTLNPITSNTFDTIGNLTPGMTYEIRVSSNCDEDACYSVTISVQTNE
jgi:hypothetical protein